MYVPNKGLRSTDVKIKICSEDWKIINVNLDSERKEYIYVNLYKEKHIFIYK